MSKLSTEDRFWAKVNKTDNCWIWSGAKSSTGYGSFGVRPKNWKAHHWSWAQVNGELTPSEFLDHTCWNRLCVNPDHLRVVTNKQNAENRSGARNGSRSGIRGVTWHEPQKKWVARVQHDGKRQLVGYFKDLAEAEAAVIAKRLEMFTHNDRDRSGYKVTS